MDGEEKVKVSNKYRVTCRSCKAQFLAKLPEGRDFGEPNYKLYNRPPLTCPKCGFQENSDFDHHRGRYYFRNFENNGKVIEAPQQKEAPKTSNNQNLDEENKKGK